MMIKHQVLGPCQRNSFEEVDSTPSALWTRAMFKGEVPQGEFPLIFFMQTCLLYTKSHPHPLFRSHQLALLNYTWP